MITCLRMILLSACVIFALMSLSCAAHFTLTGSLVQSDSACVAQVVVVEALLPDSTLLARANSDEAGLFSMSLPCSKRGEPAYYVLRVQSPQYRAYTERISVPAAATRMFRPITLDFPPSIVRGKVVESGDPPRPLRNVQVELRCGVSPVLVKTDVTLSDGSYTLELKDVQPDSVYYIEAVDLWHFRGRTHLTLKRAQETYASQIVLERFDPTPITPQPQAR